jgi:hypothetical protein
MKEGRKNVQNKILEKYPRLFYVLCACHPLNIYVVVNDGASFYTETTFFLLYKNFTLFFWFYKQLEVVKEYVSQLALKPLNATRWSSRVDAVIRLQLCEICDALSK